MSFFDILSVFAFIFSAITVILKIVEYIPDLKVLNLYRYRIKTAEHISKLVISYSNYSPQPISINSISIQCSDKKTYTVPFIKMTDAENIYSDLPFKTFLPWCNELLFIEISIPKDVEITKIITETNRKTFRCKITETVLTPSEWMSLRTR
ncbi:hypothetical protein [Weissella viridescens]|uniref:hypothetical protein n=1 Tax=Weissella viridescens TaxID=1629 RepID=UPI003AF27F7B